MMDGLMDWGNGKEEGVRWVRWVASSSTWGRMYVCMRKTPIVKIQSGGTLIFILHK